MAVINMNSIMGKVRSYIRSAEGKLRMKQKIEQYRRDDVHKTAGGGKVVTYAMMREAAWKFIKVLLDTARGYDLPPSVMQYFYTLNYSEPQQMPDGSTTIFVYFDGDGDLHRESLMPEDYSGIDNVVALLNNGYDEHPNMAKVWGEWHGRFIHGLTERAGLQFIQQAVNDFNSNYGTAYNVTAVAGDDYQS